MKLWEGMSRDLNFNVMYSPRGQINLAHSPAQMDAAARRGNIMRMNGIDAELMSREDLIKRIPILDYSAKARFPIVGGLWQSRAGTARHDAVAWGYARGASERGVDIIQGCEVTGYIWDRGRIVGVETTRGQIKAKKVGMAVAGHSSHMAQKAGLTLPIETHILQAFVTEAIKPVIDCVVSFGAVHFYVSQSDKGGLVMGGDLDGYNSYGQRGDLPIVEDGMAAAKALVPLVSRLQLVRHWAGVMDMSMDGSPIMCKSPVEGLYINGGWCYGGFKATPASGWCYAHTIANEAPHPLNEKFTLDRFRRGYQLDEKGMGPTPWAH
jgi:sarcosine oxidase subunit beta